MASCGSAGPTSSPGDHESWNQEVRFKKSLTKWSFWMFKKRLAYETLRQKGWVCWRHKTSIFGTNGGWHIAQTKTWQSIQTWRQKGWVCCGPTALLNTTQCGMWTHFWPAKIFLNQGFQKILRKLPDCLQLPLGHTAWHFYRPQWQEDSCSPRCNWERRKLCKFIRAVISKIGYRLPEREESFVSFKIHWAVI